MQLPSRARRETLITEKYPSCCPGSKTTRYFTLIAELGENCSEFPAKLSLLVKTWLFEFHSGEVIQLFAARVCRSINYTVHLSSLAFLSEGETKRGKKFPFRVSATGQVNRNELFGSFNLEGSM